MLYNELIQKLYHVNLFGGMKLGLQNCLHLSKAIGNPETSFEIIHVAGSNGKGSVTKKIASSLQAARYRVGLYTSPHISCFRERIRINDTMISEASVTALLPKLFDAAEKQKICPTFFEFTTLLALSYFAKENIDIAVLEVGIGGRLDATNIVTPKLSVITSISLEHTEILGQTIEAIALEKAGVIKPHIPVVIGPHTPQNLLMEIAKKRNSPCVIVSEDCISFEEENNAIAKKCLEVLHIPESAIQQGLASRLPCRLEILQATDLPKYTPTHFPHCLILDVAHNPDGIQHLLDALRLKFPTTSIRVICGFSKTKDILGCLRLLKNQVQQFHLVESKNDRGATPDHLKDFLLQLGVPLSSIFIDATIEETVSNAMNAAATQNQILLVCGTFFIMGDVRHALGIDEPQDAIDLNERKR
ncbi:MAG: bifunctional folylpolyglutamate synthase/dihydrofolate synthase [Parachlamydiaceae bacterium]|nr:bifunctional folylpolyglutamate synthase/dihydrofolate synthase [Parachlamydiaceae bacterium]